MQKWKKTFREEFEDIGYFAKDRAKGKILLPKNCQRVQWRDFKMRKRKKQDILLYGDKSIGDEGRPMHLRLSALEGKSSNRRCLEKTDL